MEQTPVVPKGSAKATKLSPLRQPDCAASANDNLPASLEATGSPTGMKVFVSRRHTEQTTQKSPLKILHGYISKVIKRKSQLGKSKFQDEFSEMLKPTSPLRASYPDQSCTQIVPLEEMEAPSKTRGFPAPESNEDRLTFEESLEGVALQGEGHTNGVKATNGHPVTDVSTGSWHGELTRCSIILLPTVHQPICRTQHFGYSASRFQRDLLKPLKEDDDDDCKSNEDATSSPVKSSSSEGRKGEPLNNEIREVFPTGEQEGSSVGWGEWMSRQALVPSVLAVPWQAGIEHFSNLRTAFSEVSRQPSRDDGPSARTEELHEISQPHAQMQGSWEDETTLGNSNALPLILVTPGVTDVGAMPLTDVIRLEQPSAGSSNSQGIQRGLSASIKIITNILERVVTALEDSAVVLSACSITGPLDEPQILVVTNGTDASPGETVSAVEEGKKNDRAAANQPSPNFQGHADGEKLQDTEEGKEHVETLRKHMAGDYYYLDALTRNREEHPETDGVSEDTWNYIKGLSMAVALANASQCPSPSGIPVPHAPISSMDACSLQSSSREEPDQPAVPAVGTLSRNASLLDSSADSGEAQSNDDGGPKTTFLQVAQCTTMPVVDPEGSATIWGGLYAGCGTVKPLLSFPGAERTEQVQSADPGLVRVESDQALRGISCAADHVLSNELRTLDASETDGEDTWRPCTNGGSTVDRFWTLLGIGNEPIPAVQFSSGGGNTPESLDYLRDPVLPYDAAGLRRVSSQGSGPRPVITLSSSPLTGTRMEHEHGNTSQRSAIQWTPLSPLSPICEGEGDGGGYNRQLSSEAGVRARGDCELDDEQWWETTRMHLGSGLVVAQGHPECYVLGTTTPVDPVEQRIISVDSGEALNEFSDGDEDAETATF